MISRPKLESIADKTARAPLIGVFGALVKDWIPLIDEYYYCAYFLPCLAGHLGKCDADYFCGQTLLRSSRARAFGYAHLVSYGYIRVLLPQHRLPHSGELHRLAPEGELGSDQTCSEVFPTVFIRTRDEPCLFGNTAFMSARRPALSLNGYRFKLKLHPPRSAL